MVKKHIQVNAYGQDYAICGLSRDSWRRRKVKVLELVNIQEIQDDLRKHGLSFGYRNLDEAKDYLGNEGFCLTCVKVANSWGYLKLRDR